MRPKGKVSQTGIAQQLGLSQGLVSRILNGNRQHIATETYDRVWQQALAIGYRPKGMNSHAATAADQIRQVGLILRSGMQPTTQSNFYSHVQAGLQSILAAHKITLSLIGSEDSLDLHALPQLPSRIAIFGEPQPLLVRALRQSGSRVVAIGAGRHGWCHTVGANELQSLTLLVAHLHELGHRRIGWIGGEPGYVRHQERLDCFRQALALHGLPALADKDCVVVPTGARNSEGRVAIRKLLRARSVTGRPTAVIAYNGTMARGAINALAQDGWRIPRDLSVAAVDATRVCTEDEPTITGASAVPEELGKEAARLLLLDLPDEHGNLQHLEIRARLRPGDSTAAPSPNARTRPKRASRQSRPQIATR